MDFVQLFLKIFLIYGINNHCEFLISILANPICNNIWFKSGFSIFETYDSANSRLHFGQGNFQWCVVRDQNSFGFILIKKTNNPSKNGVSTTKHYFQIDRIGTEQFNYCQFVSKNSEIATNIFEEFLESCTCDSQLGLPTFPLPPMFSKSDNYQQFDQQNQFSPPMMTDNDQEDYQQNIIMSPLFSPESQFDEYHLNY